MSDTLPWHQALVYALLGERHPELGEQSTPSVARVEGWLRDRGLVAVVRRLAAAPRSATHPWPLPVPEDLRVSPAQFSAALYDLRARLGLLGVPSPPAPLRPLSPDEVRLLREVPPHHGH